MGQFWLFQAVIENAASSLVTTQTIDTVLVSYPIETNYNNAQSKTGICRPTWYDTGEFHITVFGYCLWFQGSVKWGLYVFCKLSHDTAQRAPGSKHMHKE